MAQRHPTPGWRLPFGHQKRRLLRPRSPAQPIKGQGVLERLPTCLLTGLCALV